MSLAPLSGSCGRTDTRPPPYTKTPTLGTAKGPHIDNYVINGELGGVCSLLDEDVRSWAFWGYCSIVNVDRRQGADVAPGDSLVRELTNVVDGTPQFVIAHLYLPGHTSQRFRYDNSGDKEIFVEQYREASNRAAVFLGQIIEHVRSNDPTAILFVFGDHGMYVSRGVELEEDPAFCPAGPVCHPGRRLPAR